MTIDAHRRQVADVRASLLVQSARETHRDVYSKRRPRVPATVTVESVCESIGDLGQLLTAAESDQERSWLVLRLGNRLDLLGVLMARGGDLHVA